MKKLLLQKRSCSKRNRSRSRRVLLAALIAGASLVASDSAAAVAHDFPSHSRGGISILVHEFDADAAKKSEHEAAAVDKVGEAETAVEEATANEEASAVAETGAVAELTAAAASESAADVAASEVAAMASEVAELAVADEADVLQDAVVVDAEAADEEAFCEEVAFADVLSDTHDSVPAAPAKVAAHRTSSDFNQLVAAAVSASAARAGISVQQFLEPFAMVGPMGSAPLATTPLGASPAAEREAIAEQDAVAHQDADLETKIAVAIAAAQPAEPDAVQPAPTDLELAQASAQNRWWLDDPCRMPYESDFAELFEAEAVDSQASEVASVEAVAPQSSDVEPVEVPRLVGSGPIITTIPEAYAPYDLAERDLKLLNLPLMTVAPIKSKNYVTIPEQVAVSEPAVNISPECLLDEVVHGAAELIERTRVTDLTFASLGESFGDWFAALAPTPAPTAEAIEIAASDLGTQAADGELNAAPLADVAPAAAPQEQLVVAEVDALEAAAPELMEILAMEVGSEVFSTPLADAAPAAVSQEQIALAELEAAAPEVLEIVAMEVGSEVISAPVADAAPQEQLAVAEIEAADQAAPEASEIAISEIAASEIATMEVDGEVIPAPVPDAAPDAEPQEQLAVAEIEATEEAAPEASEIAASEIATMEVDGELIPAPVADAAPNAEPTQQVVSSESEQPAVETIADAELDVLAPGTDLSLSAMLAAIEQWQKETMAAILAAEQAAAEIAERTDADNDNVLR